MRFFITIFIDSSFACYFIVMISIFNKITMLFGRKMRACATIVQRPFEIVLF